MVKRLIVLAVLMISVSAIVGVTSSWSFNPLAHIFIAERVFPHYCGNIDLYYGSIAPDLALSFYVKNPDRWPTARDDTHHYYIDLRPYARGGVQQAFAKGWLTHNEEWGADFYAHISYEVDGQWIQPGYVYEKAADLADYVPDL